MFEFITISSGQAVVQHAPTGRVYRFRPIQPGSWSRLALDRVDAQSEADVGSDQHADAALSFAEEAAGAICHAAADLPPLPRLRAAGLFGARRPRRPEPA